eukprot:627255-Amphidinium_carterae.1
MCGDCKSLAANALSGLQHFVPVFQIRWRDVQIDPFSGQGVIVLPLTKTSARTGAQESVTIHDPWVGRLIY